MYQLAQINVARLIAPLGSPQVAEFEQNLQRINTLAEQTPGFVWRLQSDDGDATAFRISDDPLVIVNMSVWQDIEALYRFTYNSEHQQFFARRREWLTRWDRPSPVLWWVPAETQPTLEEAQERINHFAAHGATPYAFDFKQRFSAEQWQAHLAAQQAP